MRGNGLDESTVMGAIQRARRKFFLRPRYLVGTRGDLVKVVLTKRHVVQDVLSRFLFGNPVTEAQTSHRRR